MTNNYNLFDVLRSVLKWKKTIIAISFLAALGTAIYSFFLMDNFYQATTQFYAASPDLAKPEPVGMMSGDRDYYGEDEDIDRVLSLAESSQITSYLIKKYDLYEHYDIDTSHIKAPFFVAKKLAKLYKVTRTKYGAIQLALEDKDRTLCATMVNDARNQINSMAQVLIKDGQRIQISRFEDNIKAKESEITMLGDSLQKLRAKYSIYNTVTQSEVLPELVAKAKSKLIRTETKLRLLAKANVPRDTLIYLESEVEGLKYEVEGLNGALVTFNKGMSVIQVLTEQHEESRSQIALDKERLKQLQAVYNSDFKAIYVIEAGVEPVVKSRPGRTILVLSVAIVAFVFSVLGALLLEAYRDINWKEVLDAN